MLPISVVNWLVHVRISTDQTLKQVIRGFDAKSAFSQVAGAIDGTHIPIIQPQVNTTNYLNRKGFHSLVIQAVVDFRGLFTDMHIGWLGRVQDARIFLILTCI